MTIKKQAFLAHLHRLYYIMFFCSLCYLAPVSMVWGGDHYLDKGGVKSHEQVREETISSWTCAMHPQIRLSKPGKCPICGMALIPVKQDVKKVGDMPGSLREISLSPYAMKLAQIETYPVERKPVSVHVRMAGKIEYDETRLGYITAWVPGRIDKLYVNFTGVSVRKGEPMVYIYSPKLLTAQAELIEAIKTAKILGAQRGNGMGTTVYQTIVAAREKLRLMGLSPNQIRAIVKKGRALDHITILSPMGGRVITKNAFEGMYVKTGTRIYTVADISRVWVELDAYEADIVWIRKDQWVEFQAESYPGETFKGKIAFIDPFLNPKTRAIKVRVDVLNKDYKLKPGMFVHGLVKAPVTVIDEKIYADESGVSPLVIPVSAPLITGKRAVVYVAVPGHEGTFEGREVVLGPRAGDFYVVLSGLRQGERVVTRGNFKIDSSLQIQAKPSMMSPEGGGGSQMQHGGMMSMKKKKRASKDPMTKIPTAFTHQIKKLVDAYLNLSKKIKRHNLTEIKQSFKKFEDTLALVNMDLLSGHHHMVWMELSMLMKNDSVLGRNAEDVDDAQEAFEALEKHIERLKSQLNISLSAPEKL